MHQKQFKLETPYYITLHLTLFETDNATNFVNCTIHVVCDSFCLLQGIDHSFFW